MSNFFAKFSPDGKWIVFCKAENYMLLMPDSELYIIPAEGGEARRLRANTPRMNSWHSWSSNGRWLVFSSKANTPYTQLFLTHIDEEGRSTPPVVLDRFTGSDRAANIPEFVPLPADSIAKIKEQFLDAYSFLRAGMANERTGNYPGAVRSYEARARSRARERGAPERPGVRVVPAGQERRGDRSVREGAHRGPRSTGRRTTTWRSPRSTSVSSSWPKPTTGSRSRSSRSPRSTTTSGSCSNARASPKRPPSCTASPSSWTPESASAHYNLAASLTRRGEFAEAERHFRAALEVNPNAETRTGLGIVLGQQGRVDEAMDQLQAAIEADPKQPTAYDQLGVILINEGKLEEAASNYRLLTGVLPSADAHQKLAQVLTGLGRTDEARAELEKAKALGGGSKAAR